MAGPVSFGRYVLLDKLASGGMAEIFLAKVTGEAGFQRACVIKRILPHLVQLEGFVEMFLDEARIAARLHHPGVVQIFDLGRVDEAYFLAMEYLPGEDVANVVRQCRQKQVEMPFDVVARIGSSTAEALHYAHEARNQDGKPLGIVHRDISPSNLYVTYLGTVKVLDFGIARAEERVQKTRVGQFKGKASYMSPEQARGQTVDRRSDVWSLGVCLHEMITGQRLFSREHFSDTLHAVQGEPIPPPHEIRRDCPSSLSDAVMKALERDRDQRFATADELRGALERFLADRSYVPLTTQLGQFLRHLFGEERAEERLRLLEASSPAGVTGIRPALTTDPLLGGDDSTAGGKTAAAAGEKTVGAIPSASPTAEEVPQVSGPEPTTIYDGGSAGLESGSTGQVTVMVPNLLLAQQRRVLLGAGLAAVAMVTGVVAAWQLSRSRGPEPEPVPIGVAERLTPVAVAAEAVPPKPAPAPPPAPAPSAPPPAPVPAPAVAAPPAESPVARPEASRGPGKLTVESNLPATALLDGRPIGAVPLNRLAVPPGEHRLLIENRSLGLARQLRVTVREGKESVERADFRKGRLNVQVSPWADVWLDNQKLGETPLAAREVWEGRHALRLSNGHDEKRLTVEINAGKTTVVKETLP